MKVKYFADGTYNKHKARLVAKGFMQRLGVDFFSVFSPMATLTTVRVLLAIAVRQDFDIIHADIPQATFFKEFSPRNFQTKWKFLEKILKKST